MLLYLQVMLHFTDGIIVVLFYQGVNLVSYTETNFCISFFYPVIQFILTNTFMWYRSVTITDFHYMIIVDNRP